MDKFANNNGSTVWYSLLYQFWSIISKMIFLERGRVGGSQTDGVLMGRCVLDEVNRNVSKISPAGMLGAWLLKHTSETRHNMLLLLEHWHSNVDCITFTFYPAFTKREPNIFFFNQWQSVAGKLCSSNWKPDLTLWNRLSGWSWSTQLTHRLWRWSRPQPWPSSP